MVLGIFEISKLPWVYLQICSKRWVYLEFSLKINTSIVQDIIGDMFFHPDDHGSISHQRAIDLFTRRPSEDEFTIAIKKPIEFYITVDFISHGLSFWQVEGTFDSLCKRRKLSLTMYRKNVSNVVQMVCAINL